jgi:peptide deformylase
LDFIYFYIGEFMAMLTILEAPHPTLSKVARPVRDNEFEEDLRTLLNDMTETMYIAPGVGLAAPQIGDSRRILVVDPGNDDDEAERMLLHIVNPILLEHSEDKISYEESCLSVPEYYLKMKRYRCIKLQYQDGFGEKQERWFEDFPAIVIQHEMDHLEGITLLEHSSRFMKNRYVKKQSKRRKRSY